MEGFFVGKRKKGLIISPKDWLVIEKWQEEGIPLQIVLTGIDNTFNNVDSDAVGGRSKIHRVSYCESEIRRLWEEKSPLSAEREEELSPVENLGRIVINLRETAKGHISAIRDAIEDFAGEVAKIRDEVKNISSEDEASVILEAIEIRLSEGLGCLAERLKAVIDREELNKLQREVEKRLHDYRRTMEPEAYQKTFQTLLRDRLLGRVGISETEVSII